MWISSISFCIMEAGKLKTPFPSLSCRLFYVGIRFWQWDGLFGNQRRQRSSSCCLCRFLSSLILGTGFFCSSFPGSEHKHQGAREVMAGTGAAASWSLDYSHDRVFLTLSYNRSFLIMYTPHCSKCSKYIFFWPLLRLFLILSCS